MLETGKLTYRKCFRPEKALKGSGLERNKDLWVVL